MGCNVTILIWKKKKTELCNLDHVVSKAIFNDHPWEKKVNYEQEPAVKHHYLDPGKSDPVFMLLAETYLVLCCFLFTA